MQLSIIIVSYNARTDLANCLDSLLRHPPVADHEIIVVDNGSTDGSADEASSRPSVHAIALAENRGFAAANNVGIKASHGRHLLLLNSDTIVPPGAVDTLLARLESDPSASVAGPRLVDRSGVAELSFGDMITPLAEWRRRRFMRRLSRRDPGAIATVERTTRQAQRPDWVSGACLLVRRTDAEAVGLLDERFFMYTEDVDFCAAIRARGRHVLFVPEVEVIHLRGRSAATAPTATRRAYEASHLAFYRKHHPALVPLLLLFRLFSRHPI
jgi:GT2 family glycosyltransferase